MTALLAVGWPLLKTFWKPIAIVFAIIFVFGYGYAKGDAHRDRIWQAKIESERRSQNIITTAHEAAAIKDLEELKTELELSNAQVTALLAKADADVNAARVCLGTDSLQRINKGRKGKP